MENKKTAFFKKVEQLEFALKVNEETRDIIIDQLNQGKESDAKVAPVLEELKADSEKIRTEGRFIIEGGYLAGGITFKEYGTMMANFC